MAGNISVYGYDHQMLAITPDSGPTLAADCYESNGSVVVSLDQSPCNSKAFPLLRLPIELRVKILELVLPHTIDTGTRGIAWVRGYCAILATSRRLFNEGIRIMYCMNTFAIDVVWDGITFAYQWLLPTGLIPKRTFAFPDKLARRNVACIRKLLLRIHHVDNYTGMIKHNFSGPGLRQGLRLQVERLCQQTLQDMYEISHLHIHFQNDSHTMSVDQQILEPLMQLTRTRTLQLTGSVTPGVERALQAQLSNAYSRNSIFYLPLEIREHIYDLVLPHSQIYPHEQHDKFAFGNKGSTEILRTCAMIRKEASAVLYRTRHFTLTPARELNRFRGFLHPYNKLAFTTFPQGLGISTVLKLKHCKFVWGLKYLCAFEENKNEENKNEENKNEENKNEENKKEERIMEILEAINQILMHSPNIAQLTFFCICHDSFRPSEEEVRQEISRLSGVIKIQFIFPDP
ncbi:MAG: hypothetical protein HETSPECPRED_006593 [Heterodermia speciosa]|uniref:F-box domain-containing protein n=1 Tax=Heterodermia speciosa TaxID=116794 RepID=A0A8H3FUC2_9LECA|nr:MAG: hypothetical protein HETSPECPRED_006593 [Heterodermia speciosa]